MRADISVVHVADSLDRQSGGTSVSISELVGSLMKVGGVSTTLVAQTHPGAVNVLPDAPGGRTILVPKGTLFRHAIGLHFKGALESLLSESHVSLVHCHGLWLPANHHASRVAWNTGTPLIVQPRGMLEPWSLQHRRLKKRLALWAYQRRDLRDAACFVATSEGEYESIRGLGFKQPVAVIPNGVSMEGFSFPRVANSAPNRKNVALFLSRVHPKKGVIDLLHAWARVGAKDWLLQIAGPDECGHTSECRAVARSLSIDRHVQFLGPVYDKAKHKLYQAADLFVLPSYSENFGNVIAEALSFGLPVITTTGTPWSDLVSYRCGWWIECGVDSLASTLRQALNLDHAERANMGARGRQYVERYSWDRTATMTAQYYRWLLKLGDQANFIRTK